MRSIQKFNGKIEVGGIDLVGTLGEVTIPEFTGEGTPNIASGDSFATVLSKQQNINGKLGDLAYTDASDVLPAEPFGDLATKNEASLGIPTKTSDLSNDSYFGRGVIVQEYIADGVEDNPDELNDIELTLPTEPSRTIADIFQIGGVYNDNGDVFLFSGTLIIPDLGVLTSEQAAFMCTAVDATTLLSSSVFVVFIDTADAFVSGFPASATGALRAYYK